MQLFCEGKDINEAIKELKEKLPLSVLQRELEITVPLMGLQNCLERHISQHGPRKGLRRRLELLRAEQIKREVA